jgi:hypothetical protein
MSKKDASADRERTDNRLKAISTVLHKSFGTEPSHSFNSDIAGLLEAIDKRERDEG